MPTKFRDKAAVDEIVAPLVRLNTAFFLLVAVMAAHQAEHVAQVVQKDAVGSVCPGE